MKIYNARKNRVISKYRKSLSYEKLIWQKKKNYKDRERAARNIGYVLVLWVLVLIADSSIEVYLTPKEKGCVFLALFIVTILVLFKIIKKLDRRVVSFLCEQYNVKEIKGCWRDFIHRKQVKLLRKYMRNDEKINNDEYYLILKAVDSEINETSIVDKVWLNKITPYVLIVFIAFMQQFATLYSKNIDDLVKHSIYALLILGCSRLFIWMSASSYASVFGLEKRNIELRRTRKILRDV